MSMTANEPAVDPAEVEALLRPRPKFRRASGLCRECHGPKHERRSSADFCSDRCRTDFHNRAKKQGALLVHVAKRWRRHKKKGDFTLMTRIIDAINREDVAAGRNFHPDPPVEFSARVLTRNAAGVRRRTGGTN